MDNILYLAGALILIILNGFFVAAEFALVKVRLSRIEQMVKDKRAFAATARISRISAAASPARPARARTSRARRARASLPKRFGKSCPALPQAACPR